MRDDCGSRHSMLATVEGAYCLHHEDGGVRYDLVGGFGVDAIIHKPLAFRSSHVDQPLRQGASGYQVLPFFVRR